jgi:hypothetical protein
MGNLGKNGDLTLFHAERSPFRNCNGAKTHLHALAAAA